MAGRGRRANNRQSHTPSPTPIGPSQPSQASGSSHRSQWVTPPGSSGLRPRQAPPPVAPPPPPPQQPEVPPPIVPNNGAAPHNGAAIHSLEALLNAPARRNQPHLHPMKLNGALWFGIDPQVTKSIRNTWQNNFMGPWWNWTMVPDSKKDEWWQDFVQSYYWDPVHHTRVHYFWKKELLDSIRDRISKKKRDGIKPRYISDDDWVKMLEQWDTQEAIALSKTNSENRLSDPDGLGPHKHCAGPVGFAKIAYDMKVQSGSTEPPSFTDIVRKTHTRPDGTFIDPRAEIIVNDVEQQAIQAANSDGGSNSDGSTITTPPPSLINQIYLQRVKPKKGCVYGLGSSQYQNIDPEEPRPASLVRNIDMELRVASLEANYNNVNRNVEAILAMQKIILQNLGYDPVTMTPSPNAAASNTTPPTTVGSVGNKRTRSPGDEEEEADV